MATSLTTEHDVVAALRRRFPKPAWAMFQGVSNGTGRHARRWADALAMSVWPSRGLRLYGFEVKVSRNDFLRELKKPAKAEEVGQYCDAWWIAAGSKEIVRGGELPPAWGLLVPHGDTMKVVTEAQPITPKPIDRRFVAAILRRAAEHYDVDKIREEIRREVHVEMVKRANEMSADHVRRADDERDEALKKLQDVTCSVRSITRNAITKEVLLEAAELLRNLQGWNGALNHLAQLKSSFERDGQRLLRLAEAMGQARELCSPMDTRKREES